MPYDAYVDPQAMYKRAAVAKPLILLAIGVTLALPLVLAGWTGAATSSAAGVEILIARLGSVIGLVGAVVLWWQYVLGIRPILGRVNPDWAWTNERHRNLGIYGFLLICLHPVLMLVAYRADLSVLSGTDLSVPFRFWVAMGQIAFLLLAVIWVTSAIARGKLGYRTWKYIHFASYPILPLVFVHAPNIGTLLVGTPALQTFWSLLIAGYVLAVGVRVLHGMGVARFPYKIESVDETARDVMRYRLAPLSKRMAPNPGQFVYIQLRRFGEDHPLSVVSADPETGVIEVAAKKVGRFSRKFSTLPAGSLVSLDGPYGLFTREAENTSRPLLLVAGGIGITPLAHLMRTPGRPVKLAYAVRSAVDVAFGEDVAAMGRRAVLVMNETSGYGGPNPAVQGRVSPDILEKLAGQERLPAYEVFVCGPPPMMNAVVRTLMQAGVPAAQIHTERFSL